jgi:hypothetical protein
MSAKDSAAGGIVPGGTGWIARRAAAGRTTGARGAI